MDREENIPMKNITPLGMTLALTGLLYGMSTGIARADDDGSPCKDLPSYTRLQAALDAAQAFPGGNGGFGSNPVNTAVAYAGDPHQYGQASDPMVAGQLGSTNNEHVRAI
jgi:hypothetical protein